MWDILLLTQVCISGRSYVVNHWLTGWKVNALLLNPEYTGINGRSPHITVSRMIKNDRRQLMRKQISNLQPANMPTAPFIVLPSYSRVPDKPELRIPMGSNVVNIRSAAGRCDNLRVQAIRVQSARLISIRADQRMGLANPRAAAAL
jgi:hypothetical protein